MGRIKTALIKRITFELYKRFKDKFANNYNENKKLVEQLADVKSKKIRNVIAGYITKLKKNKEE